MSWVVKEAEKNLEYLKYQIRQMEALILEIRAGKWTVEMQHKRKEVLSVSGHIQKAVREMAIAEYEQKIEAIKIKLSKLK